MAAPDDERVERLLQTMGEADFERLEPPPSVWAGIEAALAASPSLKEPPTRLVPSPLVIDYTIDANDVIVETGEGWAEYASVNGAPELATAPPASPIWDSIDGDEVRDLWRLLVGRVRQEQASATVPFRCDAPSARRWFEMTISPGADGRVHFRSVLSFEEARSSIALLDVDTVRDPDEPPVELCAWCARGRHDGPWVTIEELVREGRLLERNDHPALDHGICGSCRDDMSADLLLGASTAGSG